jgi:hypothetical protein
LRQSSSVLYIAVDSLVPARGKGIPGFDEFTAALDHAGFPSVWLTSRSRLQFDEPRRRLGHQHPFIAEDGCCVYVPEGYFNVRPDSPAHVAKRASTTLRLGRFTCIPAAEILPAAANALEALAEDTGIEIVTLRSLSPRELTQNSGLPLREAELARQRDFDELFFFAGTSDAHVERFAAEARNRRLQLRSWRGGTSARERGVLWSLAVGASTQRCIRDLSKLYDRALRQHSHTVGVATPQEAEGLLPHCERAVLLTDRNAADRTSEDASLRQQPESDKTEQVANDLSISAAGVPDSDETSVAGHESNAVGREVDAAVAAGRPSRHTIQLPLHAADIWDRLLESVSTRTSSGVRRDRMR